MLGGHGRPARARCPPAQRRRRSLTRPGRGVAVHGGGIVGYGGVHARGAIELRLRHPPWLGRDGVLEGLRDVQLGEFLRG